MRKFLKQLFCEHDWVYKDKTKEWNFYGYKRSKIYVCKFCKKIKKVNDD